MFLNRVTPSRAFVYVTLTLAIEVENCEQPAMFRKELCLRLHKERQTDGMFTRLLRNGLNDTNMESAIYTMALKPVGCGGPWNHGSTGTFRDLFLVHHKRIHFFLKASGKRHGALENDTRKYVRGEENLGDWRPR